MKNLLLALPFATVLAGCQNSTDQSVATGALTGAAVGAIASDDDDRLEGAVLGGAAGAAIGGLVSGANQPQQCTYRDYYGRTYVAACP